MTTEGATMRGAKWAVGVAGAAGLLGGAVLVVPTGAAAIVGPQFRAGQVVVGDQAALGDEEPLLDYPLVVASRNQDDGGISTWADGGAPTLNASSYGPSSAAHFMGSSTRYPNVFALRAEQSGPGSRGAQFKGDAAQIQLFPSRSSHPKTGLAGDLFVDKDGKLWFCKGGSTWKQIA